MSGWLRNALAVGATVALVQVLAPGCSPATGSGSVSGTLDVPDCWSGEFNLNPNFFAADPSGSAVQIRIQNGGDYADFSDGVVILVDNVHEVRGDSPFSPSLLGRPLKVSVPVGVTVPGAPVVPVSDPAIVQGTVYLQKSCPTQLVALYALDSVSLDAQGNCNPATTGPYILQCNAPSGVGLAALADAGPDASFGLDGGVQGARDASFAEAGTADVAVGGEAATVLPASPPVGRSTITFQSLFDGDVNESSAAGRLTQATFDFFLGDPRDACPGGGGPPPPCRGHLSGQFQFYFQRGPPGQPFP